MTDSRVAEIAEGLSPVERRMLLTLANNSVGVCCSKAATQEAVISLRDQGAIKEVYEHDADIRVFCRDVTDLGRAVAAHLSKQSKENGDG